MVAHKDIVQGDSQGDVQYVARPVTIPLNVRVQSSPKPRVQSGMTLLGKKKSNGKSIHGRLKSTEASKGKKGKGKRSKSKGKSKGKGTPRSITPRPSQSQTPRYDAHFQRLQSAYLSPTPSIQESSNGFKSWPKSKMQQLSKHSKGMHRCLSNRFANSNHRSIQPVMKTMFQRSQPLHLDRLILKLENGQSKLLLSKVESMVLNKNRSAILIHE